MVDPLQQEAQRLTTAAPLAGDDFCGHGDGCLFGSPGAQVQADGTVQERQFRRAQSGLPQARHPVVMRAP